MGEDPLEQPSPEDREVAAEHDVDGTELARIIARASRGEPAGTRRRRWDDVELPAPRGVGGTPRRSRRRQGAAWSGPGADRRDPMLLGQAFDRLVASRGWGKQVSLRMVLVRWPELVGVTNAEHSRPVTYREGVLTVRTDATVWATSLRTIAPQLVAELNRRLGDGTVTRIVIEGPSAPSWKHGPRSVPGRGPRDTYG
ncbi:DciA family protein [Acidipropionibacterium timonense]|uniref:DUF721 domain-containing protein n=1 Tax=Acidipropionibacterium timonense TaxID=2161818 RepID=UPI001031D214|nr:DciA family protein [Acidipropionibacterium timonense]